MVSVTWLTNSDKLTYESTETWLSLSQSRGLKKCDFIISAWIGGMGGYGSMGITNLTASVNHLQGYDFNAIAEGGSFKVKAA